MTALAMSTPLILDIPSSLDISECTSLRADLLPRLAGRPPDQPVVLDLMPGTATVPSIQLLLATARQLAHSKHAHTIGPGAAAILRLSSQPMEG